MLLATPPLIGDYTRISFGFASPHSAPDRRDGSSARRLRTDMQLVRLGQFRLAATLGRAQNRPMRKMEDAEQTG